MEQGNTQAIVLQKSEGQKINLDIQHSTDWVVAASIFISGLISLIGFLITIYVVKKSTESHITSNNILISNQINLKLSELKIQNESHRIDKLRDSVSDYFAIGMKFNNECISAYENVYLYNLDSEGTIGERINIKNNYYELSSKAHAVFVYLNLTNKIDKEIKNILFSVQTKAWEFYAALGVDRDESEKLLNCIASTFGHSQTLLIEYIKELESDIYKII